MASFANTTREQPYESRLVEPPPGTPRPVGPLQALARHPVAAALPVLIGLGVALAVGLTRQPTYTAQTRLGIVTVNLNTPGALGGFGSGASQLAQAYARTLTVSQIRSAVSQRTHIPESQLDGRLSAAVIPNTPIFTIRARGASSRRAADLANVAGAELVRYVAEINSTTARLRTLLARYTDSQTDLQTAIDRRDALQRRYNESATSGRRAALVRARAAVEVAQTRSNALQTAYGQTVRAGDGGALVRVLSTATRGNSDRSSTLQLLGFLGVVAGMAVGMALALLLMTRDERRAVAGISAASGGRRRRPAFAVAAALGLIVVGVAAYTLAVGNFPPW